MEDMTTSKTSTNVGKAVWNNCFSNIFYQFGEMNYQFGDSNYQFGFGDYQFGINSEE